MRLSIRQFTTTAIKSAKPKRASSTVIPKYLGRPSNNLSAGLVGLANVGKSTFFQALTKSKLGNPANYPFATIEPSQALAKVTSDKLDHYQKIFGSSKQVSSSLTIWDIAGLTRRASEGEGLGNQFLNDIRQVDGIYQVVRGFLDDEITHIENSVDPVRDLLIVSDELILKDVEIVDKEIENCKKLERRPGVNKISMNMMYDVLNRLSEHLWNGQKVSNMDINEFSDEEIAFINTLNLLTAKPTVYLLNVNEEDYASGTNQFLSAVQEWITENSKSDEVLLVSAKHETTLTELEGDELEEYVKLIGKDSAISEVVSEMRKVLHLISFYTCGDIEARQWTLREGSTAPEAAGLIHTDLQKNFINALAYKWDDLSKLDKFDEAKLKSAGKQYRHGKDYMVEDGDVLVIKAVGGKTR